MPVFLLEEEKLLDAAVDIRARIIPRIAGVVLGRVTNED